MAQQKQKIQYSNKVTKKPLSQKELNDVKNTLGGKESTGAKILKWVEEKLSSTDSTPNPTQEQTQLASADSAKNPARKLGTAEEKKGNSFVTASLEQSEQKALLPTQRA